MLKQSLSLLLVLLFFCNIHFGSSSLLRVFDVNCSENGQQQCDYFIRGSSCVEGVCSCAAGSVISSDGSECLAESVGYGAACNEDVQCSVALGPGGVCAAEGSCACANGYHYLKGRCWKSVSLDGPCFQDEQCLAAFDFTGLNCQNSVCACRKEYYRRADACRRIGTAEDPCVFDADCKCPEGVCSNRKCQCKEEAPSSLAFFAVAPNSHVSVREGSCAPGFYEKSGQCVPEIGSPCGANESLCAAGATSAVCLDGRACGCDSTRIRSANNRICSKVALAINGTCTNDEWCVSFGAHSVCETVSGKKICRCDKDSQYDPDQQFCQPNRYVGDTCDKDDDCFTTSGKGVECNKGVCSCLPGTHEVQQDCRPDGIKFGDPCVSDDDCMFDKARCDSVLNQCNCVDNYFWSVEGACVSGVGAPCSNSTDCEHIPDSSCVQQSPSTCQCSTAHVPSQDFSSCLSVNEYGEPCVQNDQCNSTMGDLRECKNQICSCQDGAQFIFGRCYIVRSLGEKCKARAECVNPDSVDPDGYICQNAICSCQYGYMRNGDVCEKV